MKGYGWNKVGALLNMDGDYCGRIKRKTIHEITPKIWIKEKYTD